MIPTLFLVSFIAFFVIELPPGDYVTNWLLQLELEGDVHAMELADVIRHKYGLDRPAFVRYFMWIGKVLQGDLGFSLSFGVSVSKLLMKRMALTITVTLASLLFTVVISYPVGVYSAVRQYSLGDYFWTFIGFLGLSIPNFLFALILLYVSTKYLNLSVGGLFSPEFQEAPFSVAKAFDLMKHIWIPMIVVGTAGTASGIRVLRANMLDELKKPYVDLARAKGVREVKLIIKYPFRIAVNPSISTIGWILPSLVSGSVITAYVLDLPTAGPVFLEALRYQDMPLAGAFILLTGALTVIGTLISDILLAVVDPRIRFD